MVKIVRLSLIPNVADTCTHDCFLHPNSMNTSKSPNYQCTRNALLCCHDKKADFGKIDQREAGSTGAEVIHEAECRRLTGQITWHN